MRFGVCELCTGLSVCVDVCAACMCVRVCWGKREVCVRVGVIVWNVLVGRCAAQRKYLRVCVCVCACVYVCVCVCACESVGTRYVCAHAHAGCKQGVGAVCTDHLRENSRERVCAVCVLVRA